MHPDFISIGPFHVQMYGVMMALGFLIGLGNWILLGRREGKPAQFCTDLMFWVMVSGLAGARVAYVYENFSHYAQNPLSVFRIDQGGLVFYGGFIAAGVAMVVFARRHHERLLPLLDFVITSVPLAHAFGRIGCFLNGCCYGLPAAGLCGVRYPRHSIPWRVQVQEGFLDPVAARSIPLHPVQLYEAGFNVAVFGLLFWLYRKRCRPGLVLAVYLMLYATGRFVLEFWRGDRGERLAIGVFSIGQFVSLFVFLAGTMLMLAVQSGWTKRARDKA